MMRTCSAADAAVVAQSPSRRIVVFWEGALRLHLAEQRGEAVDLVLEDLLFVQRHGCQLLRLLCPLLQLRVRRGELRVTVLELGHDSQQLLVGLGDRVVLGALLCGRALGRGPVLHLAPPELGLLLLLLGVPVLVHERVELLQIDVGQFKVGDRLHRLRRVEPNLLALGVVPPRVLERLHVKVVVRHLVLDGERRRVAPGIVRVRDELRPRPRPRECRPSVVPVARDPHRAGWPLLLLLLGIQHLELPQRREPSPGVRKDRVERQRVLPREQRGLVCNGHRAGRAARSTPSPRRSVSRSRSRSRLCCRRGERPERAVVGAVVRVIAEELDVVHDGPRLEVHPVNSSTVTAGTTSTIAFAHRGRGGCGCWRQQRVNIIGEVAVRQIREHPEVEVFE
eukprot:m.213774 g.213774  ORF g.213774 m.213774 type:complete len:395 (+) comp25567_c0_seq1:465-1649(+)